MKAFGVQGQAQPSQEFHVLDLETLELGSGSKVPQASYCPLAQIFRTFSMTWCARSLPSLQPARSYGNSGGQQHAGLWGKCGALLRAGGCKIG